MKNVLVIAYYYPPKGGAGVQRTLKFANYLCYMGYNVSVLTVKEESNGIIDKSLNQGIEERIKIYRTDIKETNVISTVNNLLFSKKLSNNVVDSSNSQDEFLHLNSIQNKIKKNIKHIGKKVFLDVYNLVYIPDDKKGWIDFAVEEGRKIIKEEKIEVIYTTSCPYSTHLIGYELAKEIPIKWIADFRDPWVSNPFIKNGPILERINIGLEQKVVKKSDKVISVSKPIIDNFIKRYKKEDKNKFGIITNGYDEKDFISLNLSLGEKNERFLILYNGALYGRRSPEKILKAIDTLIKTNRIDKEKIRIKFVGEIGKEHMNIVNYYSCKFPEVVEQQEYLPHEESLEQLCMANALLLIIDEGEGSEGIYTGKIFEYIRTGKPILAVVPNGVARDLILETNTGYVAYPSRINEIENIIYKAYSTFVLGDIAIEPKWDIIKKYSREKLTKDLVEVMNDIK
ncbi:glycosyltransferase family protein [Clostridium sp. DL1XJH146]